MLKLLCVGAATLVIVANATDIRAQQLPGTIVTIAGGAPDDVSATDANIAVPIDVASDAAGNLYVASARMLRVFKIDRDEHLTAIAGHRGADGGDDIGVPATMIGLESIVGLAADRLGNLFISVSFRSQVLRLDAETGFLSHWAGQGGIGFSGDGGPATAARMQPKGLPSTPPAICSSPINSIIAFAVSMPRPASSRRLPEMALQVPPAMAGWRPTRNSHSREW